MCSLDYKLMLLKAINRLLIIHEYMCSSLIYSSKYSNHITLVSILNLYLETDILLSFLLNVTSIKRALT